MCKINHLPDFLMQFIYFLVCASKRCEPIRTELTQRKAIFQSFRSFVRSFACPSLRFIPFCAGPFVERIARKVLNKYWLLDASNKCEWNGSVHAENDLEKIQFFAVITHIENLLQMTDLVHNGQAPLFS